MVFENLLERHMTIKDDEKTFIDKMLSKREVERCRQLFIRKDLTREEIRELLFHLSSMESKLLNYSDWERYVILKFHIWIQEYIKIVEQLLDYVEAVGKNKEEKEGNHAKFSERTLAIINEEKRLLEHNVIFLIGLYLNIGKTSLSVNAVGIKEILKQRFEVDYGNKPEGSYGLGKEKGLFGMGGKK